MLALSGVGWFHTITALLAIVIGIYNLVKYTVISKSHLSSKIYITLTYSAAISSLFIFNNGGFNIAHLLGILTVLALLIAYIMETWQLFGIWSKYLQAISYTGTFLFHMLPGITEFLQRLPVDDPYISGLGDPLLIKFHLGFLAIYIIVVGLQLNWLRKKDLET